jgi:hypothetical protein
MTGRRIAAAGRRDRSGIGALPAKRRKPSTIRETQRQSTTAPVRQNEIEGVSIRSQLPTGSGRRNVRRLPLESPQFPRARAAQCHCGATCTQACRHEREPWTAMMADTWIAGNAGAQPRLRLRRRTRWQLSRAARMLEGQTDRRPGPARGTPANGIHNHEHGPAVGPKQLVHIFRSPCFYNAV